MLSSHLSLIHGQRLRYGASMASMALGTVFGLAVPLVTMAVLDGVLVDGLGAASTAGGGGGPASPSGLNGLITGTARQLGTQLGTQATLIWAGVTIVGLTALAGLCDYLRGRWAATASEAIIATLRERLYAHLDRLPCATHDRLETGDLVQRCTSDVETLRVFLATQVVEIARALLLLLIALPILWALDGVMTAVSLSLFPLIIAAAVIFFRRIKALFTEMDEAEAEMTNVLQENLTGLRVVRAFARQDYECAKFGDAAGEFRDKNHRLIQLLGNYWALSDLTCLAQVGLSLFFGAWWSGRGELSLGELVTFATTLGLVIWPVRQLGRVLADSGKAVVSLGRIGEILDEAEESELDSDDSSSKDPLPGRGHLRVENLSFSHSSGEAVLSDVSFSVRPGETVALLGPPGAGKSTLVKLLLRLYDHDTGSITLDGQELATLNRRAVRWQTASVLQEPFLFARSVSENVQLGHWDASHQQLVESTTAADIHAAILDFSHGYDTLVGERGVTLSGGQKQRLAIARALLRDAPVLILDDALSAVDLATEARILAALSEGAAKRSTILVSHRLSSVAHADRILVMEAGRIVQQGRHEELANQPGPYQRLWRIQGVLEEELRHQGSQGTPETMSGQPS